MVRVLRVSTFATDLDLKGKSPLFHVITYTVHVEQTLTHLIGTSLAERNGTIQNRPIHSIFRKTRLR